MKIRVDGDRCQGHNRCATIAPELFEADDYGYTQALNDGEVPAELEKKAQLCADNCPEYAIKVEETS